MRLHFGKHSRETLLRSRVDVARTAPRVVELHADEPITGDECSRPIVDPASPRPLSEFYDRVLAFHGSSSPLARAGPKMSGRARNIRIRITCSRQYSVHAPYMRNHLQAEAGTR